MADGASMARVSPSHLRTLSESEKTLCTLKDTDALQFQELVRLLPTSTYLDLVDQPRPDWEEFEVPAVEANDENMGTGSTVHTGADGAAHFAPLYPFTPGPTSSGPSSSSTSAPPISTPVNVQEDPPPLTPIAVPAPPTTAPLTAPQPRRIHRSRTPPMPNHRRKTF